MTDYLMDATKVLIAGDQPLLMEPTAPTVDFIVSDIDGALLVSDIDADALVSDT